jgi:hypothetical protein
VTQVNVFAIKSATPVPKEEVQDVLYEEEEVEDFKRAYAVSNVDLLSSLLDELQFIARMSVEIIISFFIHLRLFRSLI